MPWVSVTGHECPTLMRFNMPHQPPDSPFYVERPTEASGYGRCPHCGKWMPLTGTEIEVPIEQVCCDNGKWAPIIPDPGQPLEVGCYVETERWGEAVVTEISEHCISIRYEAHRCLYDEGGKVIGYEDKTIWVANGENPWECSFLRPSDDVSEHVLTLNGPYGED